MTAADRDRRERDTALTFSEAWHQAVADGHDMEPGWHDTEPSSWVAQCFACRKWLVSDYAEEEGRPYGLADTTCAPPEGPTAVRRTLEWLAALVEPQTEPKKAMPYLPPHWNWVDPEHRADWKDAPE